MQNTDKELKLYYSVARLPECLMSTNLCSVLGEGVSAAQTEEGRGIRQYHKEDIEKR